MDEALEQGGGLTEADLARVLQVTPRTVIRDIQALKGDGHVVPTRGQVKGAGRGQTPQVRIVEWWLDRQGYDRIALWAPHSVQSIKRYIATFQRVGTLHREGPAAAQIAFLVGVSVRLVADYLTLYERLQGQADRLAKLEEELARVNGRAGLAKKGVRSL